MLILQLYIGFILAVAIFPRTKDQKEHKKQVLLEWNPPPLLTRVVGIVLMPIKIVVCVIYTYNCVQAGMSESEIFELILKNEGWTRK